MERSVGPGRPFRAPVGPRACVPARYVTAQSAEERGRTPGQTAEQKGPQMSSRPTQLFTEQEEGDLDGKGDLSRPQFRPGGNYLDLENPRSGPARIWLQYGYKVQSVFPLNRGGLWGVFMGVEPHDVTLCSCAPADGEEDRDHHPDL